MDVPGCTPGPVPGGHDLQAGEGEVCRGGGAALVDELSRDTGYDEVSLCSLSSTDYTMIEKAARRVGDICGTAHVAISSILENRRFSVELALELERGAAAASLSRRKSIHREVAQGDQQADRPRRHGRSRYQGRRPRKMKLLHDRAADGDRRGRAGGSFSGCATWQEGEGLPPPSFNVSVSTFVPKPHTPFSGLRRKPRGHDRKRKS